MKIEYLWWSLPILITLWTGRCLAAGENYVGIGYNLLKANPDGGPAARGGVDPGLLITRHILNLSDGRAIKVQGRHSCGTAQTTSIFYGGKSYQKKLSTDVSFGGGVISGLLNVMFSLSSRFQRAEQETSVQHQVFQDEQNVCNLGHVRFAEELSDYLNVTVTDSFAAAACRLPQTYHQQNYMDFLENWGTHMVTEVDIGTRVIHRSQTSLAEFVRHVMKASGTDVSLGGSYMGYRASLGVNINTFQSRDSFSQSFGSHKEELQVGSQTLPEPINYKVVSIDTALQSIYWSNGNFAHRGVCHVNLRTDVIANNLHRALTEYAAYKMAQPPTDPPLVVPLTWPRGTYGLMKPASGCPAGRVTWHEGWRYQDTRGLITRNHFSSPLHLAGKWPTNGDIQMEFCIKGDRMLSEFDVDWPAGDYCILKYGTCPAGFQQGFVQWDDRNIRNGNRVGGTVPDGVYQYDTKIEFCCRDDELPTREIYLPLDKPFYFLRHTRGCQRVHQATVHEEYVQLDEAWHVIVRFDRAGGAHPYDDGGTNHRLHFCYYTPNPHHGSTGSLIG